MSDLSSPCAAPTAKRRPQNKLPVAASTGILDEYQFIFESSPVGILRVSPQRVILGANPRFVQIFGYDHPREVIGKSTRILFPNDVEFEDIAYWLFPLLEQSGVATAEVAMQKRDGSVFWCRINGRYIEQGDAEKCTVWLYEDVTQTKQLLDSTRQALDNLQETQAQLIQSEKMAALGSLVAGVAHEINTPIGVGVTAASSLVDRVKAFRREFFAGDLRKKSDLERFIEYCDNSGDILLNNLQRASELIQSFKRIAVDQSQTGKCVFPLVDYLRDILVSLRPQYRRRPLQVKVSGDEQIQLENDPGALAQIITNLMNNALMHAFAEDACGHIDITVQTREKGFVDIEFSDDGQGIPADILPRIYEPFFTTRRGKGGSGLGMHLVFNLVTQTMKGHIECRSQPGQGTCFSLSFPLVWPKP